MGKIKDIIKGWTNDWKYNRGNIPEPIKELFDERIAICRTNECGKLVGFVCSACGCPIKKKTKVITQTCPENMWRPKHYYEGMTGDTFVYFNDITPSLQPHLRAFVCNNLTPEWCEYYIKEFNSFDGNTFGLAIFLPDWEAFLKHLEETI